MGNQCTTDKGGFCFWRDNLAFAAPNTSHVKYQFDCAIDRVLKLASSTTNRPLSQVSSLGFLIDPQTQDRVSPSCYRVKDYSRAPTQLRVCISGRVHIQCPSTDLAVSDPLGKQPIGGWEANAFRICTRGHPVYESVRTPSFTHTAHVVTSGVYLSLNMLIQQGSIYLIPRILLVTESGDEVCLVEDQLSPLQSPTNFVMDFCFVDDGGRNLQADLIFRFVPGGSVTEPLSPRQPTRTMRTCLQDYSTLNNGASAANITMGYSDLGTVVKQSAVHLQNLVISEEHILKDPVKLVAQSAEPKPFDLWKFIGHARNLEMRRGTQENTPPYIVFEGTDAKVAFMASAFPAASVRHPQLVTPAGGEAAGASGEVNVNAKVGKASGSVSLRSTASNDNEKAAAAAAEEVKQLLSRRSIAKDHWFHYRYENQEEGQFPSDPSRSTLLTGEFWLFKNTVEAKGTYLQCSSTMEQALHTCIVLRFTCPKSFHDEIKAVSTGKESVTPRVKLQEMHIPMNGIVFGIEPDPRYGSLLRMYAENRNTIIEDMVVCECSASDLANCVVYQEVFDSGRIITYKLSLSLPCGWRQAAVLQLNTDDIENGKIFETPRPTTSSRSEDLSLRFPFTLLPRDINTGIEPSNGVFIYTSTAYEPPEECFADADSVGDCNDTRSNSKDDRKSEGYDEMDYHSAGGGASDQEGEQGSRQRLRRTASGTDESDRNDDSHELRWQRPLIESVVLLQNLQEPPFQCFPQHIH
eukprot:TRINITY_DN8400_c0_g1_i1.p1 TRINITY_DN8400_c0_g1~~TRINITY_DN8400_c0_g1_i1.p1  ORF type:complete len:748 (-),score=121.39 TRINITY_DN8400_c0_g1_i1:166-2409(-)